MTKYQFANIVINTSNHQLTVDGEHIDIERQTFDLLTYLVSHQGVTITREQLLESVWQGRIVSDTTISSAIKVARKCLGDSGKAQKYIKTIHGRGFQFIADINIVDQSAITTDTKTKAGTNNIAPTAPATPTSSHPAQISLLVLPLQILSALKQAESLVTAVNIDIERLLSRVPLLNISSESARYQQQDMPPTGRQIYQDIGVTYLLDGSLRQQSASIIVSVQLTDNKSGFKIWSSEFSYQQKHDLLALTSPIVLDIVAHIEPQLNRAILAKVTGAKAPHNSRSLFLQATGLLATKGWRPSTFSEAVELLEHSSTLEPTFALAPALKSLLLAFGVRIGVLNDRAQAVTAAQAAAAQALELDSMDSTILGYVGCAYCDINMLERGIPLLNSAIRANPDNGQAWVALGAAELMRANYDTAIKKLEHGIHISALDSRLAIWRSILSISYLFQEQLEQALTHASIACEEDIQLYMPRVVLAAIKLKQAQPNAAQLALKEAYSIKPDLSQSEIYGLVGQQYGALLFELSTTT